MLVRHRYLPQRITLRALRQRPAAFTPAAIGTYFWTALYNGDANNALRREHAKPRMKASLSPVLRILWLQITSITERAVCVIGCNRLSGINDNLCNGVVCPIVLPGADNDRKNLTIQGLEQTSLPFRIRQPWVRTSRVFLVNAASRQR